MSTRPQQIHFHAVTMLDGTRRLEHVAQRDLVLPAGSVLRLVLLRDRATIVIEVPTFGLSEVRARRAASPTGTSDSSEAS